MKTAQQRKYYWIKTSSSWCVIKAFRQSAAYSAAVQQEGRGMIHKIRLATLEEIENYRNSHSEPEEV